MATAFVPVDHIGDAKRRRKKRQAFYTPLPLVESMLDCLPLFEGCRVLEPSAGDGRIVHALIERGCEVDFCETDDDMRDRCEELGGNCIGEDFLEVEPDPVYHGIAMNPPFTKHQDQKHICHAYLFLRPSGTLVSIAPTSLGEEIEHEQLDLPGCCHLTCEKLPRETFKESGANVETLLIIAEGTEPEDRCLGFLNLATANAVLVIQNDPELSQRWEEWQVRQKIMECGGSVYGIDWDEVDEACATN